MSTVCKLCLKPKPLRDSHIIPRAIYRRRKRFGKPQLVAVTIDESTPPDLSNCDPKEPLFCSSCENELLNNRYERYSDSLLTGKFPVRKNPQEIILENFKYERFYLYVISILWRASISSLDQFQGINLGNDFNEKLRKCIFIGNIKLGVSLKLDHFLRVSMYRVTDEQNMFDTRFIKSLILNPNVYRGKTKKEGMCYYFMIEGFFIVIRFSTKNDLHAVRTHREPAQVTGVFNSLSVPLCDFRNIPQLEHSLTGLILKAQNHGEL
ncbi:hypothetical protein [Enterovibrio norvegicus]|uniref:hypothetical protein n=1 Tax=Enterovibrio norvegicus TaxID=188144 RepID=UPI0010BF0AE9|nr:hypothetical protein [Enterovibrio norvegicus]TKF09223.1 hypothetical protein FCV66_21190 [Enterovibrio norvegicus]